MVFDSALRHRRDYHRPSGPPRAGRRPRGCSASTAGVFPRAGRLDGADGAQKLSWQQFRRVVASLAILARADLALSPLPRLSIRRFPTTTRLRRAPPPPPPDSPPPRDVDERAASLPPDATPPAPRRARRGGRHAPRRHRGRAVAFVCVICAAFSVALICAVSFIRAVALGNAVAFICALAVFRALAGFCSVARAAAAVLSCGGDARAAPPPARGRRPFRATSPPTWAETPPFGARSPSSPRRGGGATRGRRLGGGPGGGDRSESVEHVG